jgi:hypothetical protein
LLPALDALNIRLDATLGQTERASAVDIDAIVTKAKKRNP